MLRTILIVDDLPENLYTLNSMLCNEYTICEASNGEEAYKILQKDFNSISAVILDIMIPEIHGFDLLSMIRSEDQTASLPVIITAESEDDESRRRAHTLGANDYICKPFNADIIRHSLKNAISFSETGPAVNVLRRDSLTGLYNRESFFEKVSEMVKRHKENYYVMSCFDIDKFKVINDQYGTEKGDQVLKHIASVFKEGFCKNGGICCRIAADNFAVLYPISFQNSEEISKMRRKVCSVDGIVLPINFSIGRYFVNDLSLSPSAMYDRAMLAADTVKGRFDTLVADYHETMRGHLILEQEIVNEMVSALNDNQFEAWYQPQYNYYTGALIGSEALARWRHPKKGLVPPGKFIPVFEQNGFVYELDKYIWEDACRHLRKWIDSGLNPLPVSVNISRYDIFRDDFIYVITSLIKKYSIPVELLRLEVTESAFSESASQIISVVKKLISLGFTVEIDDFGSGYSSLNTLKDVPAQVIKLDMKFLESTENSQRGGNIVESIVRMSKWLDMTVIAEGVETVRQADFLKSIGCNYIQGYLYAKPMTADQYEKLCNEVNKEERLLTLETVENLDNNSFWDPDSIDTLIFNSFVGGACVYEYCNGKIELIRATDKYAQVIGSAGMTVEDALKIDWLEHLDDKTREMVISDLEQSIDTKQEVTGEYVFIDLPGCPHETFLRTTMRVIASAGSRYLVYCTNENITAQRIAEQKERQTAQQLEAIINSVDQGITATLLNDNEVQFLFANNRYYELLGYTKEQFKKEVNNPFLTIVESDRKRAIEDVKQIRKTGRSSVCDYHIMCRNGSRRYFRIASSIGMFSDVKEPVQLSIYRDITDVKQAERELLDNLPCGAALYEYDGDNVSVVYINRRYWELVNRSPSDFVHNALLDFVHPDDKQLVVNELDQSIKENREPSCDIRILYGQDEYRFFRLNGRIIEKSDGLYSIYVAYTLISGDEMTINEILPVALRTVMDSQTDYSFVKDKNLRYICCSRAVFSSIGFKSELDILGKTDYEILDKTAADKYYESDMSVLKSGRPIIDQIDVLPILCKGKHYSITSKFPIKDDVGNIIGIYGTGHDITESFQMRSRFDLLSESINGGIATYEYTDGVLKLIYFNDGFSKVFELSRDEYQRLCEKNVFTGFFHEDLPELKHRLKLLLDNNTPVDCSCRINIKNGTVRWINLKIVSIESENNRIILNAVIMDITRHHELLDRLGQCTDI